ncbi:hypothetical protein B4109_2790 [Geobacillus stearothermophilus]|uniref:Uncharacterized protein n=1 Tax=Geobacillus stearothermophilus TaxID=1422 RepID=A0A150MSQ3_GEOSE|nr:hypothetical protein B4109_2790 [Geobacillus stearothermophilus]
MEKIAPIDDTLVYEKIRIRLLKWEESLMRMACGRHAV